MKNLRIFDKYMRINMPNFLVTNAHLYLWMRHEENRNSYLNGHYLHGFISTGLEKLCSQFNRSSGCDSIRPGGGRSIALGGGQSIASGGGKAIDRDRFKGLNPDTLRPYPSTGFTPLKLSND